MLAVRIALLETLLIKRKGKTKGEKREETGECRSNTRYFVWKKAISSNNLNGEAQ